MSEQPAHSPRLLGPGGLAAGDSAEVLSEVGATEEQTVPPPRVLSPGGLAARAAEADDARSEAVAGGEQGVSGAPASSLTAPAAGDRVGWGETADDAPSGPDAADAQPEPFLASDRALGLGGPAPEPLGPEIVETGYEAVDGVLARLGELSALPTEEHGAVYEDVHERLRETLTALDSRPGPPPAPTPTPHRS